jgi:hypothetical protein
MSLLDQLRKGGCDVTLHDPPEGVSALIELRADGLERLFAVERRRRAPYPSEIRSLADRLFEISDYGAPLLLAPYVSQGIGNLLNDHGWSWADEAGNFGIRSRGLRLFQRISSSPPKPARNLPQGKGALAIVRFLIRMSDELGAIGPTELSKIANVSQPRASQVLTQLQRLNLIEKGPDGYRADQEALLDAFLNEYRGPGGAEAFFYSLDAPVTAALHVIGVLDHEGHRVAVSGDVGADLLAPWRSPTVALVYVDGLVDTNDIGLVAAQTRHDANVVLCFPDDTSVFRYRPLDATLAGRSVPLADETQILWDLHHLGGDDRLEAADQLRQQILGKKEDDR